MTNAFTLCVRRCE